MFKLFGALVLVLAVSACSRKSSEVGGNEGANGGDSFAQNAAALLTEVLQIVQSSPQKFPEVDVIKLREVVSQVKIYVPEKTYANGYETDATNDGVGKIELNGTRWAHLNSDQRRALLFHEVLGIMGLELGTYSISSRLLDQSTTGSYMCSYRVIMPNTGVIDQNATRFVGAGSSKDAAINAAIQACERSVHLPSELKYCNSSLPWGAGVIKDSIVCSIQ